MKRWTAAALLLMLALALASCGGDKNKDNGNGGDQPAQDAPGDATADGAAPTRPPSATATFPPPAPRSKELPGSAPVDFQAPFSAGVFMRATLSGSPAAAGGQRATYSGGDAPIVLSVYYFQQAEEATRTVEYALSSGVEAVGEPHYARAVSFGLARTADGGALAAWSHQGWAFVAQTAGSVETLQAFLDVFPY